MKNFKVISTAFKMNPLYWDSSNQAAAIGFENLHNRYCEGLVIIIEWEIGDAKGKIQSNVRSLSTNYLANSVILTLVCFESVEIFYGSGWLDFDRIYHNSTKQSSIILNKTGKKESFDQILNG